MSVGGCLPQQTNSADTLCHMGFKLKAYLSELSTREGVLPFSHARD